MPPRKRAESKPAEPEAATQETELPDADSGDEETAEAAAPAAKKPAQSDLQAVEAPCPECFPNGWPDGGFGLGCEHGTWYRT